MHHEEFGSLWQPISACQNYASPEINKIVTGETGGSTTQHTEWLLSMTND